MEDTADWVHLHDGFVRKFSDRWCRLICPTTDDTAESQREPERNNEF